MQRSRFTPGARRSRLGNKSGRRVSKELQGAEFVQLDARHRGSPWQAVLQRFGGAIGVLAAFLAAYILLVWLGYRVQGIDQRAHGHVAFQPDCCSPRCGFPIGLTGRHSWLCTWLVEFSFAALLQEPFVPGMALLFVASNAIDSIVGASIARWLISDRSQVRTAQTDPVHLCRRHRLAGGRFAGRGRQFIRPVQRAGLPAADPGLVGGQLARQPGCGAGGVLLVCSGAQGFSELALRSRVEMLVLAALLALASVYVFSALDRRRRLDAAIADRHARAAGVRGFPVCRHAGWPHWPWVRCCCAPSRHRS